VSFAVPLSFTLDGSNFVLHPGYAVCREEVKKESYLRASISQPLHVVIPLVVIATCYCRASANQQKTYVNAERWAQEERKEKMREGRTRLFAALILGTLLFWVPTSACDIADAFTLKQCLPQCTCCARLIFLLMSPVMSSL